MFMPFQKDPVDKIEVAIGGDYVLMPHMSNIFAAFSTQVHWNFALRPAQNKDHPSEIRCVHESHSCQRFLPSQPHPANSL